MGQYQGALQYNYVTREIERQRSQGFSFSLLRGPSTRLGVLATMNDTLPAL